MQELKFLNETEQKVDKILKEKDERAKSLENSIKEEDEKIEALKTELLKASRKDDIEKYREIKNTISEAEDLREMHKKQLNMLVDEPMLSKTEYENMISKIIVELTDYNNSVRGCLANIFNNASALGEEFRETIKRANTLLNKLQEKMYLNQDRMRGNNGNFIDRPLTYDMAETGATYSWAKAGVEHGQYNRFIGNKGN